ncbi:MAG TPA: ribbon-helix-helix protein, CopG family [Candidatus Saccharimonadales bacterium]
MSTQIINLSLPEELVRKIDRAAQSQYASRSEFIRQAVVTRLRTQDDDIWAALAAGADEVRTSAEQAGYKTDEDFVRAVKEVRQEGKQ